MKQNKTIDVTCSFEINYDVFVHLFTLFSTSTREKIYFSSSSMQLFFLKYITAVAK